MAKLTDSHGQPQSLTGQTTQVAASPPVGLTTKIWVHSMSARNDTPRTWSPGYPPEEPAPSCNENQVRASANDKSVSTHGYGGGWAWGRAQGRYPVDAVLETWPSAVLCAWP